MSRWPRRIRRFASAASAALLAHGCAVMSGAPATSGPGGGGDIAVRPGRPGLVVAAPHGATDVDADEMAVEIARRTGFGLVVATGRSGDGDARAEARRGAEAYTRRVLEAGRGSLRFYAEILGHDRQQCGGQIEIATVGIDRERALRLRALAELIRDAHLRGNPEVQRLRVLVEPVDEVTYRAPEARRAGLLRLPQQALHIELPGCAERDYRETYTSILADFLTQAVLVAAGR